MAKFTWSGAQDTNWFNPNNWNPAIVPTAGSQVVIPAGLTNYPVVADSRSVTLSQNISLGGPITINSTGDNTDLILNGGTTLKFNGGGSILLSDNGANRIYSNQGSTVLELVDDSISGAGQIFSNGGLSILVDAAGVINASAANNQLRANNILITNNGLVEATGAAGLALTSVTLDQSGGGTLKANGGNVFLNSMSISGGTLQTSGGGLIETTGGTVTLDGTGAHPATISAGSTVQINDATNLTVVGVINDKGTIFLDSGQDAVHFDNTDLIVNGGATTTLQGGGVIQLSDSGANRIYSSQGGTTLENVDDTITGAGQIFSNAALTLQNDAAGVINASAANNQLRFNNIHVVNNGLVEATGAAGLALTSVTLDQSGGGTLKADGGNVYLNSMTIAGGTLTDAGAGLIQTTGGAVTLDGSAGHAATISTGTTVQVNDATNLTLLGVINNSGTLFVDSGQDGVHLDNTDLLANANGGMVTLQGGGIVQLSDSGNNRIYSNTVTTLENVNNTLTGAGQIFSNGGNLTLQNDVSGIVNASSATNVLSIYNITVNNAGLIESTSTGGLQLSAMGLNNTGTLKAAGGNVYLSNTTISGGTLTTTGGSLILTNGSGSTLNGAGSAVNVTAGSAISVSDATNLAITGTLNNAGNINLNSGQDGIHFDNTDLLVRGGATVTLTGGGAIQLVTGGNDRIFSDQANTVLDNINNKIQGSGQILSNGGNLSFTNEASGVVNANNTGQTLSISSISVTNKGLLTARNDGVMTLNSITLTQSGAGQLAATQGNIYFNNSHVIGGSIVSSGGYAVATNGGGALLDGSSAALSIVAGSTVQVSDANNLYLTGAIANAGTIFVDSGQDGVHFDNTDVLISGAANLTGGGTVLLSNSGNNRIYSNASGSFLTNTNDTIIGSGQIFSNGGNLSIANLAGGTIEAGQGDALIVNLALTNSGVLEGNGGVLVVQGPVTGSGTAMVANGGSVGFTGTTSLGGLVYAGPNAGSITVPFALTPTVTGFAAGDSLSVLSNATVSSLQFTENGGGTSGVLTIFNGGSAVESFTFNGFYTTQDFALVNGSGQFAVVGVGDNWIGGSGTWNTAGNWSQGLPGADDDVVINSGSPSVTAPIGTIRSLSVASSLNFGGVTGNTVKGMIYDSGVVSLDAVAGQGGASLSAGSLDVVGGGSLTLGNATLSANDQLTVGAIVNNGAISLTGSATKLALLNAAGPAGFGTTGVLNGAVSLAGDSAIKFANGAIKTIAAGGSLVLNGTSAFVEIASTLNANSALTGLTNLSGSLSLENGATIAPTGALYDVGALKIDDISGAGGTIVTLPTLYVSGALSIGNAAMTVADQVNVATFRSTGAITLTGGATAQAVLNITAGGASFDNPAGKLYGSVSLSGSSAIKFASGAVTSIAADASLREQGKKAFLTTGASLSSNSALTTLALVAGSLSLENGASIVDTVGLTDSGAVSLDGLLGEGGSSLTVKALNVSGALTIGNANLSAATNVNATTLSNTGAITMSGSAGFQSLLNVGAASGFGTLGVLTGAVNLSGNSAIAFSFGGVNTIANNASLRLAGGSAYLEIASQLNSNSALKTLGAVNGSLALDTNVTLATTVSLANSGTIAIDGVGGEGGSQLTTTGTFTNNGTVTLGNSTLATADLLKARALANSGVLNVIGGASTQALVNIGSAAGFGSSGVLTGTVSVSGNSAIEFLSGTISTVASGSSLTINGPNAFIESATALNQNSALTTLNFDNGAVSLHNAVQIASSRGLTIAALAQLNIDNNGGEGGSHATFAGALVNTSALTMGNASLSQDDLLQASALTNTGTIALTGATSTQALLNITGAAAFAGGGTLTGNVSLTGDAAIEFASGTLTGIGSGAFLLLNGPNAYIETATALNSNSALSGLSTISGEFDLFNGGSVTTSSQIVNSGQIEVWTNSGLGLNTSLTTTQALRNNGALSLQATAGANANITVTAASLANTGSITLNNASSNTSNLTLLNVGGAAGFGSAGILSGSVTIGAQSAVEFATGSITQIAKGASLELGAASGVLENASGLGSNSALTSLGAVAGVLQLDAASIVATTAALVNSGAINLNGAGGLLSTTGKLTNTGALTIGGAVSYAQAIGVTAAALANTGTLNIASNGAQASLKVAAAAGFGTANLLSGSVTLNGNAVVNFASGAITTLTSGSLLHMTGSQTGVTIGSGGASALTTLGSVSGTLELDNGAIIADTAAMTIAGGLFLDSLPGEGGSSLTDSVSIKVNATGTLNLGNTSSGLGSSVSTASLTNAGSINLTGNGSNHFAQLSVSGAMTNNGQVFVISDVESIAGSVSGTGTFDIWNGSTLSFGGAVGTGQTVTFDNSGTLGVNAAGNVFQASIAGFAASDTINLGNFAGAGANWSFAENGGGTAGVLTLTNGASSAQLNFAGLYSTGDFSVTGTGANAFITHT